MGIYFDGGDRLQRGRGVGGLLKLASKLFSPLTRIAKKAIQSNTGKQITNAVKEQAIQSSINVASDIAKGRNIKDSIEDEFENAKTNSKKRAFEIGIDYLKGRDNTKRKKKVEIKKNSKKKTNKKIKRDIFV